MKQIDENYYSDDDGVIHLQDPKPFVYSPEYVEERYVAYGWQTKAMSMLRLHFIRDHMEINGASVLDVGYGDGDFLNFCRSQGMYAWGYDISGYPLPNGVKQAQDMQGTYNLITFFDSLEHFTSVEFVEDLKTDFICVSVPWCHYPYDKQYEWFKSWKHLRPEEHYLHFGRKSLVTFMKRMGFSLVEYTNIEDSIRGNNTPMMPNILTAFFRKDK